MHPTSFADLPLSPALHDALPAGVVPTPIQAAAIPVLLDGRDLLGQAATGSGKTWAFALPLLQRLRRDGPVRAVVLCPTRELCAQLVRELRSLGRGLPDLRVIALSGGAPIGHELRALGQRVHVVVGTPGRTLDHLQRGSLRLEDVEAVVLDEADRMLDLGLLPEVEAILQATPPTRQTALLSATVPPRIRALADRFLTDPVQVQAQTAVPTLRHLAWPIPPGASAIATLSRLLASHPAPALVFCTRRATVEEVTDALAADGHAVAALHGGLDQGARDEAMVRLRQESARVLVATDVAARGLDIEVLPLVVHYDLPFDPDDFLHRAGRTGRAGREGLAISLVRPDERERLEALAARHGLEVRPVEGAEEEPRPHTPRLREARWVTLRIGGGRRDKLRPGDLVGALTGEAGLTGDQVGPIEIGDRVSYVAVAVERAAAAARRLGRGRIKGRRFRVSRLG